ncbi:MAG: KamA family radical SAM protein [Rhodothermales bacterium]|nr:KamA family radical SAM protein [Rhodothermales bacterium]
MAPEISGKPVSIDSLPTPKRPPKKTRPEPDRASADTSSRSGSGNKGKTSAAEHLERIRQVDPPEALKPPVPELSLRHRHFSSESFWQRIPAFSDVSREEFSTYKFQNRHSVTSAEDLHGIIGDVVDDTFIEDVDAGLEQAPMMLRLSPYLLSLIDWDNPYEDPIRRQFIPAATTREPDHPMLSLDSLGEQNDSPVPGLVHRYRDKVLFLALDVCPVYCRFCTRSYAIGGDTDTVEKQSYKPIQKKWDRVFAYLLSRPEVEDVVVSGGDAYFLPPKRLRTIGETLLAIPHIRRIRFATKGPAVMPMKILSDDDWTETLLDLARQGRERSKEVCLHTHFNHASEITEFSRLAMNRLFEGGLKVRNQSVLIRGVNDGTQDMIDLVRRLSYINVQPYYVYQHDMVEGVEELRTPVARTVELEKQVRGDTAGFNTPVFVTDAPGGGGKRSVHSYEYYDETTGISVYRSPSVDDERVHLYFDPLSALSEEGRRLWADEANHAAMVDDAVRASGYQKLEIVNA